MNFSLSLSNQEDIMATEKKTSLKKQEVK